MANKGGDVAAEYITHHLTDWCWGCNAQTGQPSGLMDFGAFTLDLLLIAFLCAIALGLLSLYLRRILSVEKPGRLQVAFEFGVEYISEQVGEVFRRENHYVGAMALTIFIWVTLMNLMDLVPVDLLPEIAGGVSNLLGVQESHFRHVSTAALDTPFAMAIVMFVMMIGYQIRANGPWGYVKRFLFQPYGKYGLPMNLVTTAIDDLAKPGSLALRLFGNMFAGELIFVLLALLTIATTNPLGVSVAWWAPVHFVGGLIWSLFDMLIGVLQAFIFAVLTIVYLGMAQQPEGH
jgi:F-type H+-transporting ATPase subunit a